MSLTRTQANALTSAVWLIGIGTLIETGWWWPGVMFLIGASSIAQALVDGQGWYALQAGLWSIGIGAWVLTSYSILALFALIAVSGLAEAFLLPAVTGPKPEPDAGLHDDAI